MVVVGCSTKCHHRGVRSTERAGGGRPFDQLYDAKAKGREAFRGQFWRQATTTTRRGREPRTKKGNMAESRVPKLLTGRRKAAYTLKGLSPPCWFTSAASVMHAAWVHQVASACKRRGRFEAVSVCSCRAHTPIHETRLNWKCFPFSQELRKAGNIIGLSYCHPECERGSRAWYIYHKYTRPAVDQDWA